MRKNRRAKKSLPKFELQYDGGTVLIDKSKMECSAVLCQMNSVVIKHCDKAVVEAFACLLKDEKLNNADIMKEYALNILKLAREYKVDKIISYCHNYLHSSLSSLNVLDNLTEARCSGNITLERLIVEAIVCECSKLVSDDNIHHILQFAFRNVEEYPQLLRKIQFHLLGYKDNPKCGVVNVKSVDRSTACIRAFEYALEVRWILKRDVCCFDPNDICNLLGAIMYVEYMCEEQLVDIRRLIEAIQADSKRGWINDVLSVYQSEYSFLRSSIELEAKNEGKCSIEGMQPFVQNHLSTVSQLRSSLKLDIKQVTEKWKRIELFEFMIQLSINIEYQWKLHCYSMLSDKNKQKILQYYPPTLIQDVLPKKILNELYTLLTKEQQSMFCAHWFTSQSECENNVVRIVSMQTEKQLIFVRLPTMSDKKNITPSDCISLIDATNLNEDKKLFMERQLLKLVKLRQGCVPFFLNLESRYF